MSGASADLAARLHAWAEARGMDATGARLRLEHERLLARMDIAMPLQWTVRGGRAIELRLHGRARRTADLDVSLTDKAPPHLTVVREMLTKMCQPDIGDGWRLSLAQLDRSLARGVGVVGYKARLAAHYESRPFGEFSVDVSRAGPLTIGPLILQVPGMLTDAPIRVAVVRPEVQVAEKVHAFTRPYPAGARRTRSYDLVDAVAMVLAEALDPAVLRTAAQETFRARGTHPVPLRLAAVPAEWATAFQLHGAGYGLAQLTTAEGLAILSGAWERAMTLPAG